MLQVIILLVNQQGTWLNVFSDISTLQFFWIYQFSRLKISDKFLFMLVISLNLHIKSSLIYFQLYNFQFFLFDIFFILRVLSLKICHVSRFFYILQSFLNFNKFIFKFPYFLLSKTVFIICIKIIVIERFCESFFLFFFISTTE